ncbi:MAG: hypothetical protein G8345_16715 [Magnetococcales bacterium]|nr:hypothetical protein [Magnetococcales bacterium]
MSNFAKFWPLSILLVGVLVVSVRAIPNQGHLANSDCQSCHLATTITNDNANVLVSSQEEICLRCHPNALKASHPTGFHPRRRIPNNMPLDWKGDLTCSTCHSLHAPMGSGILRHNKRGQAFCLLCHDQTFFTRMVEGGSSVMASGHIETTPTGRSMAFDSFSSQCIACHTEMAGGNKIEITDMGVVRHGGSNMSHPLGSQYDLFGPAQGYRLLETLPPQIVLPDGKISCISCHEGYSQIHGKLVISNRGSGLCLACHNL